MCQVCLGRQSESLFSRRACWSTHVKICASLRQKRAIVLPVGGEPLENRGSPTARNGQEPHTPGGTLCVARVGGEPLKLVAIHDTIGVGEKSAR